jgi:hypothetical protein
MHHSLAIAGLALNAVGSFLLLWFTPTVGRYTPDGWRISGGGAWSEVPQSPEEQSQNKRRYAWRKNIFRLGVVLLVLGFVLQLIDLLRT